MKKMPELPLRFLSGLRSWPQQMVLAHVRLLGALVLTAGLAVAVLLSTYLFLLKSEQKSTPVQESSRRLSTETIDRLELWIEDVDAERAAGFAPANRALFVVEDLKVEDGN